MQSLIPLVKASLGLHAAAAVPAVTIGCSAVLQRLFSTGTTKRLYVGNLSFQTKADQLAEHFGTYGSVQDVVIPLDQLGRSRGYAFVEMDAQGADAASGTLNQSQFMGRTIFVNDARPKEERPRNNRRWQNNRDRPQQQQQEAEW